MKILLKIDVFEMNEFNTDGFNEIRPITKNFSEMGFTLVICRKSKYFVGIHRGIIFQFQEKHSVASS